MPKQTLRLARGGRQSAEGVRDMALDIVSYGRRGPGGTLRFGSGEIAQIQERLAQALLDPQRAAALMQPKGPIGRSLAAAPLSLAARSAPVALTSPNR